MEETLREIAEYIAAQRKGSVVEWHIAFGELTVVVGHSDIVAVTRFLRDDPRLAFVNITDICGVDYPQREKRFDVVYHLLSPQQNVRIRLKVMTDEATPVPSLTAVYPGADWFEREAYDFYGIRFSGHPDLRRILTDYGFEGYPLRKDFPLTGYRRGPLRRRAETGGLRAGAGLRSNSAISISSRLGREPITPCPGMKKQSHSRLSWPKPKSAPSTSISGRNILQRMVFCGLYWSLMARSWSVSIRISVCFIAAPRS